MRPDDWHLTEDADGLLARTGTFLRSRPVRHIVTLGVFEGLRARKAVPDGTRAPVSGAQAPVSGAQAPVSGAQAPGVRAAAPVFGWLERAGEVGATFYHLPSRGIGLTALTPAQADGLAARLAGLGYTFPYVSADQDTAAAFAAAWRRHAGVTAALGVRLCLYRLGELAPPRPAPAGRGRPVGEGDRERLMGWCRGFAADVGEDVTIDATTWAGTRFAGKRYTFWELPDGTPVSMAGRKPRIAGVAQVDPVYTPARFRGRGFAGAVTAEVSRAALAAGAAEVVLFANAADPTSNALYQRLGFVRVTGWATYDFARGACGRSRP
ncbi:GNAT family N-acetyltransferase [Streptomyces sp. NPDC001034]|uniref:GNAT family N-acetyltransferase n=1 Tax=Streptomyces sp. NPDC001034 TaxID=3154375 RepID=UPI00332D13A9